MTAGRGRPQARPAAGDDRRHRTGFCRGSKLSAFRRSTRIFQHDVFAEKNPIVEVDRNRLIRFGRADRMRPPHGYAVCGDFFKRLSPVDAGCSHADRRDLSAAASVRDDLGIKRQISAALGDVGDRLWRYTNHGLLRLVGWVLPPAGSNRFRILVLRFQPHSIDSGISMRQKTARSSHHAAALRRQGRPPNVLRLTTEGFCPIVEPFAKRGISATDIVGFLIRESTSKDK